MKELNLYQKLAEIRQKISVKKTGFNNFGKYNYYEIDEIYKQTKKLFLEYSIFTKFSLEYEPVSLGSIENDDHFFDAANHSVVWKKCKVPDSDKALEGSTESKTEHTNYDQPLSQTHSRQEKVGIYKATLTVINADKPEEQFDMRIDSPLNEMKASASQMVGSNNTYQSKYLYMDLLMLDDGASDPDKTETHGKEKK